MMLQVRRFRQALLAAMMIATGLVFATQAAAFPSEFTFGDEATGKDFTIAAWFNTSQLQTTDVSLISNKNWGGGSNPGYVLTVDSDDTWKLNANGDGGSRIDTDWTAFSQNTWNFVVATFDRDGNFTAYTNGGSAAGGSESSDPAPSGNIDTFASPFFLDFNIGQDGTGNYGGGQGFIGLVDDVAIWDRALDAAEVTYIFNQGAALSTLTGNTGNGGTNLIGDNLVGYYAFDSTLADGTGNGNDGVAKTSPENPGSASYAGGLFGNALSLDGSNYVTIGEGDALPPNANFTGNDSGNNLASDDDNWDLPLANWGTDTGVIVGTGTTATFASPNTGPATFDSTFPSQSIKNLVVGADGESTFVDFEGTAEIIGVGTDDTVLGSGNSTVTLNMTDTSRIEHRGASEENSEIDIAKSGSTTTIVMDQNAEISAGPRVADAGYVTGVRRSFGADRLGDDIKIGNGGDADVTMNGDSIMFSPDVIYMSDADSGDLTFEQNGNSKVIANWDTRWFDTGGHTADQTIDWTMNNNSELWAARDHNMGETKGEGTINLEINGNAVFRAGDRIAIGSGGGNVNVTINGGLIQAGQTSMGSTPKVDGTGSEDPSGDNTPVDWILTMGHGANANLTVNGGTVNVGRNAYVGIAGGNSAVNMNGGTFNVLGVGNSDENGLTSIGNNTANGSPGWTWFDEGGDLLIGVDGGNVNPDPDLEDPADNRDPDYNGGVGTFNYAGGVVSVARDVIVGATTDGAEGGTGQLNLISGPALSEVAGIGPANSFTVGGDLGFGQDLVGATNGKGDLKATLGGSEMTTLDVTGDVLIAPNSDFTVQLTDDYRPDAGEDTASFELVEYDGSVTGTFNFDDTATMNAYGIDFSLDYVTGSKITLNADKVYLPGDANFDDVVDGQDFSLLKANFGGSANWTGGDFNADGTVDGQDFSLLKANFGSSTPAEIAELNAFAATIPEPASLVLLGLGGVISLRWRRAA